MLQNLPSAAVVIGALRAKCPLNGKISVEFLAILFAVGVINTLHKISTDPINFIHS